MNIFFYYYLKTISKLKSKCKENKRKKNEKASKGPSPAPYSILAC